MTGQQQKKGVSKAVLIVTNVLLFLIAAAALGITLYLFFNQVAKSLTKVSLISIIGIASLALMIFSIVGCRAASAPPQKKCSKCLYLSILLVLFLAEFIAAGYVFNLGNALQVAEDKGFNVKGNVTKATEDALVFLHDQLQDLYKDEGCTGGGLVGEKLPYSFSPVHCNTKKVQDVFTKILTVQHVTNATWDGFHSCETDEHFTSSKSTPSNFTQAFCGSESHIVSLAHQYSKYLVWFPVLLAGLTFILLVATLCLLAQKQRETQRQIRVAEGRQPLHAQLAAGV